MSSFVTMVSMLFSLGVMISENCRVLYVGDKPSSSVGRPVFGYGCVVGNVWSLQFWVQFRFLYCDYLGFCC